MKGTQNAKRLYDSSQFPEDKKLGSHLLGLKDEVVFELDPKGNVLTGWTMQNSFLTYASLNEERFLGPQGDTLRTNFCVLA